MRSWPVPDLIFPLNSQLNAALSLGKRDDDVELKGPAYGWREEDPALFAETNFAFDARAQIHDVGATLKWKYGPASFSRAIERDSGVKVVASFPTAFNFLFVRKRLDRKDYMRLAARAFVPAEVASDDRDSPREWNARSTLDIYVNGLRDLHYTYRVTKLQTTELSTDQGAYDAPQLEFEYTRFDCRLESL
jgi:hypothetical protein